MSTPLRLIPFPGITTDCLGHYLMGLGLLRAVSSKWPTALGFWHEEKKIFHLAGAFEEKDITEFLAQKWQPTPYVKWWTTDQKADTKSQTSKQLWARRSIGTRDDIRVSDCTIVPTHRNQFNPLFGTGGNIGKRDLASAHESALEYRQAPEAASWLESALFGKETTEAPSFANGGTWFVYNNKTFNSGLNWYREGYLSPWSYLLAMEGALLMRGGSGKRLGSHARPYAVFPFISQPLDPDGQEEVAQVRKGEFWAPLWKQPANLGELNSLLQRGLARVGGKAASAPHEFAVAALAAGTDAGISGFIRFEFRQTTSSQVYEAIPRQTFTVEEKPVASKLLTGFLGNRWFDFLPYEPANKKSKTKYRGLRGRIERLVLEVAQNPTGESWQALWLGLANAQDRIDHNRELRGAPASRALPKLAAEWLTQAFPEIPSDIRLAAAFASLGAGSERPAICNIFGVEPVGIKSYNFCKPVRPTYTVWHDGAPQAALLDLVQRRLIDSKDDLKPLAGPVRLAREDIAGFLAANASSLESIQRWIPPLSLLDWSQPPRLPLPPEQRPTLELLFWAFFKPFFLAETLTFRKHKRDFFRDGGTAKPGFTRQLFHRLRQGATQEAIDLAVSGYHAQGWRPIAPIAPKVGHERLASALALSIPNGHLAQLIERFLEPNKSSN